MSIRTKIHEGILFYTYTVNQRKYLYIYIYVHRYLFKVRACIQCGWVDPWGTKSQMKLRTILRRL